MHNGLFVGQCSVELVYYLPHALFPGQRMKAERQLAFAGGSATNAAIAFTAFENVASLVTGLGEHPLSEVARSDIMAHAIALIDLDTLPHRPPSVGSVLVDLESHEYGVAYSTTYARKLRSLDVNETIFHDVDIVFLDGTFPPQAREVASRAKHQKVPVVLATGIWREGLEELLPFVDYLIISQAFRMGDSKNSDEVFNGLSRYGVQHIIITRAEKPMEVFNEGTVHQVPVGTVRVLDTLGAGDILHGAFCHYIKETDFLTAAAKSGEVASFSCSSLGPRAWMEQINLTGAAAVHKN